MMVYQGVKSLRMNDMMGNLLRLWKEGSCGTRCTVLESYVRAIWHVYILRTPDGLMLVLICLL